MAGAVKAVVLLIGVLLAGASMACGGSSNSASPAILEMPVEAEPTRAIEVSASIPEATPTPKPAKTKKVVVLDPGHGGDEIGAGRNGVTEKESNLDMAFRVEKLLIDAGFDVVLTRRTDARAAQEIPGFTATRSDLQARLDIANASDGDLFVSIHSNGSEDLGQRGVETWYDSNRQFAAESLILARLLQSNVLRELRAYGYAAQDRGLFDGVCFRQREGRCFTLFVIAGARATSREEVMRRGGDPEALGFNGQETIYSRPANMPAALVELLIITNASDAAVLRDEAGRNAMARGVAGAITAFFQTNGGG